MSDWRPGIDQTCPKVIRRGTHRSVCPEETLARVQPMALAMGITRLGDVTGLDRIGLPVAIAVRPNSLSFSVSQGKGLTRTHALASAVMEAAEAFHGEDLTGRVRQASLDTLAAEVCVVDPVTLCGTGDPFDPTALIEWIEGYDLLRREACWVPAEIVDTDSTLPRKPGRGFFLSGTNGLASGNHMLEALSSAICEVVERDAVALWNAQSVRARRLLDLDAVDDPDACEVLEAYRKACITVRVWDATSDVGLATFVCDIRDMRATPSGTLPRCRGSGCHPDRKVALLRALTEAAQVRLTHVTGARDDITAAAYRKSALEELGIALIDAASQAGERASFHNVPTLESDGIEEDVRWALDRLVAVGIDRMIAVDLTRPEFDIPVVRVIVPGLEWTCSDPFYVPGRRARRAACDNGL
jgi:ribosomal protein S12 methylthiotransferase accessory factor